MTYTEFQTALADEVQLIADEGMSVSIQQLPKNNGVIMNALCIRHEHDAMSPLIYLDSYYTRYTQGVPLPHLARYLLDQYRKDILRNADISIHAFQNFEAAQKNIYCRVVNYELNTGRLLEIPHKRFLDLAITYYYQVDDSVLKDATVMITNSHCSQWNLSPEALHETAWENTVHQLPPNLQSMEEALCELLGEEASEEGCILPPPDASPIPMYLLSNKNRCLGAICMLYPGALRETAAHLQSNLFILPSSIHECILIPESQALPKEELEEMVKNINATQLEPQEVLSNRVYYYSRCEDRIQLD
ncbi:DUF5688 family protein [Novisyntrophococcus fermenticellae]|uniref:DUF5688 family protein n=1 Tax=Novisyntrophococcus fermenticellae TaxID=2068655 RepID=UPI001E3F1C53|nr:DUF5688 family protein [Novisyntrophococcus fermenticellae]